MFEVLLEKNGYWLVYYGETEKGTPLYAYGSTHYFRPDNYEIKKYTKGMAIRNMRNNVKYCDKLIMKYRDKSGASWDSVRKTVEDQKEALQAFIALMEQ